MGTLATAITGVVTAGVKSYADLEQNVGGIETLFKDSADTVINNAKKAYETAGMSANEYMQQVTSFSASLLQSLGGDTEKAAQVADMAIQDMADNSNKMGTSMELIQNAYQGFAKQNYTMLDNLKLGYGVTKEEMERLLADAEKISGIKYDISSLNDVYQAIHVIQENMDITGTTAKEASTTITGSFNSAKSAFDNFLNGTGDVETLSDTLITAFSNVGKAVGKLAPDIINGLVQLVNGLIPQIPTLLQTLLPALTQGVVQLIQGLVLMVPQLLPQLILMVQTLITSLAQTMPTFLPTLVQAILQIVPALLENLPTLIQAGIQLIIGLATGLIDAIPIIIGYLPQIITSLVNGLVEGAPQIVQGAFQLIGALAQGLVQAIPQIVANIPQILTAIVNGIIDGIGMLLDVGKDLVKGLWDGITGSLDWIKKKIKGWVGNVLDFIKGLFGIHSPSTEFAYFGRMNVLGLEEGMEDMEGSLNATIGDMVNLSPSLLASASNSYNPNVNVVVNNQFEQDPLGQMVQRRKTFASGAKNDYNFGMGV